ncbi:hypothetical protein [Psychromonas sp. GE-S-Ul-11]|uniref:hypothetical protein n=1 Tax=Psychromonas sp. GE-S-Ul-11 TaxID=3241170 RepID=UPI00390C4EE0
MSGFSKKIDVEASLRRGLYQELTLIMAFIEQQNYQLENYLSDFSENLVSGGQGIKTNKFTDLVSVSNVSNDMYDLESTFKKDLPNYIRKSQLLMLWAMLEDTLSQIVKSLSEHKGVKITKKAKDKESIFHLNLRNLDKINKSELLSHNSIGFLNDNVREIRNSLVHGYPPRVTHDEVEVTETGTLVSEKYIWEVCMSMHDLSMCL